MTDREATRRLVHTLVERYNAKDVDGLIELYHPDARYWSPLGDWQEGTDHIRSHLEELHRTLPDERMEILALMADDGIAVAEFASTGTRADGAAYRIEFTEVIEVVDGRIASVKVYLDPEEVAAISG